MVNSVAQPFEHLPSDPALLHAWALAHPDQAELMVRRAAVFRSTLARDSVNEFIELVGKDEETGKPVRQARLHRRMQNLANTHPRLVIWSHPEGGKTNQFSILRPLWRLGRNANLRVVIVSETSSLSRKIVRAQQGYLQDPDSEIHDVFPELLPGTKWTETAYDVQRHDGSRKRAKDFSVQAIGVGSGVMGTRIDELLLDDVLTHDNTRSERARAEFAHWFNKTIMSRLSGRARVTFLGNAWHPLDQMHRLAKTPGWFAQKFPVLDAEGRPTWPEKWPAERIDERRRTTPPTEFARELLCEARSDEDARFKQDWIDRCLRRGDGLPLTSELMPPSGYRTYTGVDLGTREKPGADLTVFFTLILHPDGSREVLEVQSGRWNAPEIMARLRDVHRRFRSIVAVEGNAAQDFIRQLVTKESAIPVLPFTTDKTKHDPAFGVETLAVEMFNGKWIIPSSGGLPASPELAAWISEMLHYTPGEHTGDRLMASWIAKQAAEGLIGVRRKGRVGSLRL